jgi:hypothetical protein
MRGVRKWKTTAPAGDAQHIEVVPVGSTSHDTVRQAGNIRILDAWVEGSSVPQRIISAIEIPILAPFPGIASHAVNAVRGWGESQDGVCPSPSVIPFTVFLREIGRRCLCVLG